MENEGKYFNMQERWMLFDRNTERSIKEKGSLFNDVNRIKRRGLLYGSWLYDCTIMNIVAGNYDIAEAYSRSGEICVDNALKKGLREYMYGKRTDIKTAQYSSSLLLYKFRWINNKAEDLALLKETLEIAKIAYEDYVLRKSTKRKGICKQVIKVAIKLGEFDTADEYFKLLFKRKKNYKPDKTMTFDKLLFYSYIIEYLKDKENKSDLKDILYESFDYLYDEIMKGNISLSGKYNSLDEKVDIAYIRYKYFSDFNWDTVNPVRVIRSMRDGFR